MLRLGFSVPFLAVLSFLSLLDAPFSEEPGAPLQQAALVDEDEVDRSRANDFSVLSDDNQNAVGSSPVIQAVHPQRRLGWSRRFSLPQRHAAFSLIIRAPPAA